MRLAPSAVALLQGPLWIESEADGAHGGQHGTRAVFAAKTRSRGLGVYKGERRSRGSKPTDLKSLGRPGGRFKHVKLRRPAMRVQLMTAQLAAASPI